MRTIVCFLVLLWGAVAASAADNVIRVSSIIPAAEIAQSALLLRGTGDAASCGYNSYHKRYDPSGVRSCCRRASGSPSVEPTSAGARPAIRQ
jgi:hypothetical protein